MFIHTPVVYISLFMYKQVHWMYFVAFTLVAMGLVIYHSTTPPIPPTNQDINAVSVSVPELRPGLTPGLSSGLEQWVVSPGFAKVQGLGPSMLPTADENNAASSIEISELNPHSRKGNEKRDGRRIGSRPGIGFKSAAGAGSGLVNGLGSLLQSTYNPLRVEEDDNEALNDRSNNDNDDDGLSSSSSSSTSSQ